MNAFGEEAAAFMINNAMIPNPAIVDDDKSWVQKLSLNQQRILGVVYVSRSRQFFIPSHRCLGWPCSRVAHTELTSPLLNGLWIIVNGIICRALRMDWTTSSLIFVRSLLPNFLSETFLISPRWYLFDVDCILLALLYA